MENLYEIGLISTSKVGENLVLNMAEHGSRVAYYSPLSETTGEFAEGAYGLTLKGVESIPELVAQLASPCKIMLIVNPGKAVDEIIAALLPHLAKGTILLDGSDSHFMDTSRRCRELKAKGISYIGLGITGGQIGALLGPCLMSGGDLIGYTHFSPLLERIAAQVDGRSSCGYVGPDGAGHFAKMIHNGIEYGNMELASEGYYLLKLALGLGVEAIQQIFLRWNTTELASYQMAITAELLGTKEGYTGLPYTELTSNNVTRTEDGSWLSVWANQLGVPAPTITQAIGAQSKSAYNNKGLRTDAASKPCDSCRDSREDFIADLHAALYASMICCYAQGFALLSAASSEFDWSLRCGDIALMWRGGSPVRANFLDQISNAFSQDDKLSNIMFAPFFNQELATRQAKWRQVVITAKKLGIPVPILSASLDYYDSFRQSVLAPSLLQAHRHYSSLFSLQ